MAAVIRAVPQLRTLKLPSCGLSQAFFETDRLTLTQALQGKRFKCICCGVGGGHYCNGVKGLRLYSPAQNGTLMAILEY